MLAGSGPERRLWRCGGSGTTVRSNCMTASCMHPVLRGILHEAVHAGLYRAAPTRLLYSVPTLPPACCPILRSPIHNVSSPAEQPRPCGGAPGGRRGRRGCTRTVKPSPGAGKSAAAMNVPNFGSAGTLQRKAFYRAD
jgi:hypothetical protein